MARTKGKKRKWSVVHPRAAGIDIGSQFHVVAVPEDFDAEPVRTFSTFTNDLHRLADWLKELGIGTVAMESTGVYWVNSRSRRNISRMRRCDGNEEAKASS